MCSPDSQPMVETQGTVQDAWGQPLQPLEPQPAEVGAAGQDWGASQSEENIAGQRTSSRGQQSIRIRLDIINGRPLHCKKI
jgi:hypothetical protein